MMDLVEIGKAFQPNYYNQGAAPGSEFGRKLGMSDYGLAQERSARRAYGSRSFGQRQISAAKAPRPAAASGFNPLAKPDMEDFMRYTKPRKSLVSRIAGGLR